MLVAVAPGILVVTTAAFSVLKNAGVGTESLHALRGDDTKKVTSLMPTMSLQIPRQS